MSGESDAITVLHVDDESDLATLVADMLERDGAFTVETATDAEEGLAVLAEGRFDCVVSDYAMPGMDGIEFLEAVRADYSDLPFILYTGRGSEEVASEAITAGATDYLQKGGGTEQYDLLKNRIRNAVAQYRSEKRAVKLDRIRTLASDINQALVRADCREEAESSVCERIVATDRYEFAWIGAVDTDAKRLRPRATAGADDDYLDEIAITAGDGPTGREPTGTAIRERRVAVTENIAADSERERWAEAAIARGFQSIAAVPLAHEGTLYGVLTLYADDPRPFDEDECDLLSELGADVGHALHSFAIDEQRREERDRREALFVNAPTPVAASRPLGENGEQHITDVNEAFETVFGFDRDVVVGEAVMDVLVPEEYADEHAEFRERTAEGEAITADVERLTTDGIREFIMHIIPYGLGEGSPDGNYVWYTDVTDRTARERELRAFRQAVEHAGHAVYWTDPDGVIEYVNPAFERQSGYSAGEAIGQDASILNSGEHDEAFYVNLWETILDGETWEGELVNEDSDGEHYVVEQTITPVTDEEEVERFVAINVDVTDRKERERERDQANTVLRTIVENLPMAVLVEDADRDVLMINERLLSLFDAPYSTDALIGQDCTLAAENFKDYFADPEGFIDGVDKRIDAREPVKNERLELADGRVLERDYVPYTLPDGEANLWLYRDVTDRIHNEQRLEQQNERLDQFAGVVSHDLRNPLNVASSRLELAAEECDSGHLEHASMAIERSLSLIEDLRTLTVEGMAAIETEPVGLANAVADSWQTVMTAEATLSVETDRTIDTDPGRLRQLLANLFANAVTHAGEDVAVTVGPLEDGFYVEDNGPGIPADDREAIFEPGHSTAEGGTGFGLAIVEAIADAHDWTVSLGENENGGARFEFTGVDVLYE